MKEHIPIFAMIAALGMVLGSLVLLTLRGMPEGPVVIGLVGAVGTIVGVIGGFSQQKSTVALPPGSKSQETRIVETPASDAGTAGVA
jgi:hypothetical protein